MGKPKPSKKKKKRVRPDGEDSKKEKKTSYSIEDILNKAEECLDEYNFDLAKVMLIERERIEERGEREGCYFRALEVMQLFLAFINH